MKISQSIKMILLSFYEQKTKLLLITNNKAFQELLEINIEHYKLYHFIKTKVNLKTSLLYMTIVFTNF